MCMEYRRYILHEPLYYSYQLQVQNGDTIQHQTKPQAANVSINNHLEIPNQGHLSLNTTRFCKHHMKTRLNIFVRTQTKPLKMIINQPKRPKQTLGERNEDQSTLANRHFYKRYVRQCYQ